MKKIAIIGAMAQEVSLLKEHMQGVKVSSIAGMDFYEGTLCGRQAVVVQSGVGKVHAALCVQVLALAFHQAFQIGCFFSIRACKHVHIQRYVGLPHNCIPECLFFI